MRSGAGTVASVDLAWLRSDGDSPVTTPAIETSGSSTISMPPMAASPTSIGSSGPPSA